jgi:hypothetical protein
LPPPGADGLCPLLPEDELCSHFMGYSHKGRISRREQEQWAKTLFAHLPPSGAIADPEGYNITDIQTFHRINVLSHMLDI